jgi:isoleucyl-tRNA synthetase
MERLQNWDRLIVVRNEVLKVLETARREKFIGNALEAKIELSAQGEWARLLEEYKAMLPMLFIVSHVELTLESLPDATASSIKGLLIAVRRAEGKKCERCWNYSTRVGEDSEWPTLCERCVPSVREIESGRPA